MTTKLQKAAPRRDEYRAWFDQQVKLGLDDLAAGRIHSHGEFTARMERLFKDLARGAKKAA